MSGEGYKFGRADVLALALMGALSGQLTPNFCEVLLDAKDGRWVPRFRKTSDHPGDAETLIHITSEWFSLAEDYDPKLTLMDVGDFEVELGTRQLVPHSGRSVSVFLLGDYLA